MFLFFWPAVSDLNMTSGFSRRSVLIDSFRLMADWMFIATAGRPWSTTVDTIGGVLLVWQCGTECCTRDDDIAAWVTGACIGRAVCFWHWLHSEEPLEICRIIELKRCFSPQHLQVENMASLLFIVNGQFLLFGKRLKSS